MRPSRLDALWKEKPASQSGGGITVDVRSSYTDVGIDGSDESNLPVWLRSHGGFRPSGPARLGASASAVAKHDNAADLIAARVVDAPEPIAPRISRANHTGADSISRGLMRSATAPTVGWAPVATIMGEPQVRVCLAILFYNCPLHVLSNALTSNKHRSRTLEVPME